MISSFCNLKEKNMFNSAVIVFTIAVISVLISAKRTINCDTEYESSERILHCASLEDLKDVLPTIAYENFTILSIGEEQLQNEDYERVILKEDSLPATKALKTLEIFNLLKEIKENSFKGKNFDLDYALLKGNNLNSLKRRSFTGLKVTSLDLINNKIELIEAEAFEDTAIENLDLSDNKIVNIVGNSLPCDLQELKLNRNNIFRIEANTFPAKLYILHLNFNNIKNCKDLEGLKTSSFLETLSISSNKIQDCTQFPNLLQLQTLNMSENKIKIVLDTVLDKISNIQYLYLGYNQLEAINLSKLQDLKELHVEYNLLHYLNLNDNLSRNLVKFSLTGNPFTCKCLNVIYNYARTADFEVEKCENDSKNGIPDCIVYGQTCEFLKAEEYQRFVSTKWYEQFLNSRKLSSCYKHK